MTRAKPTTDRIAARARALADPTRLAVLRTLQVATAPTRVDELADAFSLHPNAIRQHLAELRDAGLVIEERSARGAVGRPPLVYRATEAVTVEGTRVESPYEHLAVLLVEVAVGGDPVEVGAAAGKQLADRLGTREAAAVVERGMQLLGFETRVEQHEHDIDLVLANCPYATAVRANPLVCEVHRGMATGLARMAGATAELEIADPAFGGCRIHLSSEQGVKH